MRIAEQSLRRLATDLLQRRGAPLQNARLQADLLVEAELRGLPSHGLQRLPRLLTRIDRGLADPAHPVLIPGDGMRARRSASLRDGIELPSSLLNELRNLQAA